PPHTFHHPNQSSSARSLKKESNFSTPYTTERRRKIASFRNSVHNLTGGGRRFSVQRRSGAFVLYDIQRCVLRTGTVCWRQGSLAGCANGDRSEEHTAELQS